MDTVNWDDKEHLIQWNGFLVLFLAGWFKKTLNQQANIMQQVNPDRVVFYVIDINMYNDIFKIRSINDVRTACNLDHRIVVEERFFI